MSKGRTTSAVLALAALSLAGTAFAEQYVFIAKGNKVSAKMQAEITAAGGTITSVLDPIGVVLVEGDDAFAAEASSIKGVQDVVADVTLAFDIETDGAPTVSFDEVFEEVTGDGNTPTDSFGFLQWDMDAINTPEAHALGYTGAGVRVAILDSGIQSNHIDLMANLNMALSTSFVPGETFDSPAGSHGTHVAGTVAAAANGVGIVGVAPDAELVAVKVLSALTGSGSFGGIIAGIVYAADIDADVINMSLGIPGGLPKNIPGVQALINATKRATQYAHKQGVTIVATAGNDARDLDKDGPVIAFPGQLPFVITVSALGPVGWAFDPTGVDLDQLASYSNFGQSAVHFSGPGGDFVYPGNEICLFGIPCWVFDMQFSTTADPSGTLYSWSAGTSMAAPHVAGVAALIIGANGGDMHPAQVEAALRRSSDDLGKPGNDDAHGGGRINALNAVQ